MSKQHAGEIVHRDKVSVRINLVLIGSLTAACVVLGGGSYLMRRYWVDRNAGRLVERAAERRAQDDNAGAIADLGRYLRLRPKDDDAKKTLAELLETSSMNQRTVLYLHQLLGELLSQNPDDKDLRKRLVRLSVAMRRHQEVFDEHLPLLKEELLADDELRGLAINCYTALEKWDEAVELLLAAQAADPTNVRNYQGLAAVVELRGDGLKDYAAIGDQFPEREGETSVGTVRDPQGLSGRIIAALLLGGRPETKAQTAAATYFLERNQAEQATEHVEEALRLTPDDADAATLAIDLAFRKREAAMAKRDTETAERLTERVRELATKLTKADPPDWRGFLVLSRLAAEARKLDEAEAQVRQAVSAVAVAAEALNARGRESAEIKAREFRVKWALANLLLSPAVQSDSTRRESVGRELRELADELKESQAPAATVELLDARILAAAHEWQRAAEKLEQVRNKFPRGGELMRTTDESLVECYRKLADRNAMFRVFERGVADDDSWIAGRAALAAFEAERGRGDVAAEQFERLAEAGVMVGQALRQRMLQQMRMRPEKRNWAGVEERLARFEREADPWRPEAAALRADLLLLQGDTAAAEAHLAQACERNPDDRSLAERRIAFVLVRRDLSAEKRSAQINAMLDAFEQRFGDQPSARIFRAELAVVDDRDTAAAAIRECSSRAAAFTSEQRRLLYESLAPLANAVEDGRLALELLQSAAAESPDDVELLGQLGIQAIRQNNQAAYESAVKELQKIERGGGPTTSFLSGAAKLAEHRRLSDSRATASDADRKSLLEGARSAFAEAVVGRAGWALAHRYLGVSLLLLGNEDAAYEQFREALKYGDRSRETLTVLTGYLQQRKRYSEVVELLRGVEEYSPLLVPEEIARAGYDSALRSQQYDDAMKFIDSLGSPTATDKINRAIILMSKKQNSAEAEQLLREAVESAPELPQAWIGLVDFLVRENRLDDARTTVSQAEQSIPDGSPGMRFKTLGVCYELLGELAKADQNFQSAHGDDVRDGGAYLNDHLGFCLRNGRIAQAQSLLKLMLDPKSQLSEAQLAIAKRAAALIQGLAPSSYPEYEAALQTLGVDAPFDGVSTNDLRALADVLLRGPFRKQQLKLIEVLETLDRKESLTRAEQRQLALLYEQHDRSPEALERLRRLRDSDASDVAAIGAFIQIAASRKEPTPALVLELESAVDQLELLNPRSFRTAFGKSRVAVARGEPEAAAQVLTAFVDSLRRASPAEMFQELVSMRRETWATNAIQRLSAKAPPQKVREIAAAVQRLRNGDDPAAALRVLAELLSDKTVAAAMRCELIRLTAMSLEELQRLDLAESMYRKCLAESVGPEAVDAAQVLAAFFSRHGRIDEGLAVCREFDGKLPPHIAAQLMVAVVRAGRGGDEVRSQVEQRLMQQLNDVANGKDEQPGPEAPAAERQEAVKRAAARAEQFEGLSLALADLYDFEKRFDKSGKIYKALLKQNPSRKTQVVALNNLAWIDSFSPDSGTRNAALPLIDQAVKLAGPIADLLDTRAMVFLNLGKNGAALDDLNQALGETARPSIWLHLALAQLRTGKTQDAADSLRRAESSGLDPNTIHPLEAGLVEELRKAVGRRG